MKQITSLEVINSSNRSKARLAGMLSNSNSNSCRSLPKIVQRVQLENMVLSQVNSELEYVRKLLKRDQDKRYDYEDDMEVRDNTVQIESLSKRPSAIRIRANSRSPGLQANRKSQPALKYNKNRYASPSDDTFQTEIEVETKDSAKIGTHIIQKQSSRVDFLDIKKKEMNPFSTDSRRSSLKKGRILKLREDQLIFKQSRNELEHFDKSVSQFEAYMKRAKKHDFVKYPPNTHIPNINFSDYYLTLRSKRNSLRLPLIISNNEKADLSSKKSTEKNSTVILKQIDEYYGESREPSSSVIPSQEEIDENSLTLKSRKNVTFSKKGSISKHSSPRKDHSPEKSRVSIRPQVIMNPLFPESSDEQLLKVKAPAFLEPSKTSVTLSQISAQSPVLSIGKKA